MVVNFTHMRLITQEDALSRCESFKCDVEPTFLYFSDAYLFNAVLDKCAVIPLVLFGPVFNKQIAT
jgi:hypothetical protein